MKTNGGQDVSSGTQVAGAEVGAEPAEAEAEKQRRRATHSRVALNCGLWPSGELGARRKGRGAA